MSRAVFCSSLPATIVSLVISLASVPSGFAQGPLWSSELQLADSLHVARNDVAAVSHGWLALAGARLQYGTPDTNIAGILHRIGVYYTDQHPDSAERYYAKALAMWDSIPAANPQLVARTLNNLGAVVKRDGRFALSEKYLLRALDLKRRHLPPDHIEISNGLNSLGNLYNDLGNYAEAERCYHEALGIRQRTLPEGDKRIGAIENNLGVIYMGEGRYNDAAALLTKSIGIQIASKDYGAFPAQGQNLARALDCLGRLADADSLFHRIVTFLDNCPPESINYFFNTTRSDVFVNYAAVKRRERQYAAAESLLVRAQVQADAILPEGSPGRARIPQEHGLLMRAEGRPEDALADFRIAARLRTRGSGKWHPELRDSYLEIAVTLMEMNRPDSAVAPAINAAELAWLNHRALAMTLPDLEALSSARTADRALGIALAAWQASGHPSREATHRIEAMALRIKGMTTDMLLQRHRLEAESADSTVVRLRDQHRFAANQLARLSLANSQGADSLAIRSRVDSAYHALEKLTNALALTGPLSAMRASMRPLTPDSLSRIMRKDELAVEYLECRDSAGPRGGRYYALVIERGASELIPLAPVIRIDSLVDEYKHHISAISLGDHLPTAGDLAEYLHFAGDLDAEILTPLYPYLKGKQALTISPAGALNLVSFAGLLDSNRRYLAESYSLRIVDALRSLVASPEPPHQGFGLLLLGDPDPDVASSNGDPATPNKPQPDVTAFSTIVRSACLQTLDSCFRPLPGAHAEIADIEQSWRAKDGPVMTYLEQEATERAFKLHAPGCRVLHLATHGYFLGGDCDSGVSRTAGDSTRAGRANSLFNSGLLLAGARASIRRPGGAPENDGILSALEVGELDLRGVRSVTLSACESGRGTVFASDGVYGLRRAFEFAGAGSVMASLWRVPDATTAELMSGVYSHPGVPLSEALRQAEVSCLKHLRSQGLVDHPFLWAGFVAYGR